MTTWRCPNCGYSQDFEMTEDKARLHFPELSGLKAGECPSCRQGELQEEKENKLKGGD